MLSLLSRQTKHTMAAFLLSFIGCTAGFCYEPQFTGPLFAFSGQSLALGDSFFELYGYYIPSDSIYDINWHTVETPPNTMTQFEPIFAYGLGEHLDVQYDLFYVDNRYLKRDNSNLGDTSMVLGYQLLDQKDAHQHLPNLRITVQEIFPTGRYDGLNINNNGSDATGAGSYQTTLGLNLEYLSHITEQNYLNTYLSLFYNIPSAVKLDGFSIYGGTSTTHGHINPGHATTVDLAGELSLDAHWVAVMEGIFTYQQASVFSGFIGQPQSNQSSPQQNRHFNFRRHSIASHLIPRRLNIGNTIGHGNLDQFTLAPALEYNFNEKIGIIGGAWFTVAGKNTPQYTATVIALVINS